MKIMNIELRKPESKGVTIGILLLLALFGMCFWLSEAFAVPLTGMLFMLGGTALGIGLSMVGVNLTKGKEHVKVFALVTVVFLIIVMVIRVYIL